MKTTHQTREAWLTQAVKNLTVLLEEQKVQLPKNWAISIGFPKGSAKAIGQCWDPSNTDDETSHMFISPVLSDPIEILATTLHEMIHAAVGLKCGHTGEFRRVARGVGLKGKLTATFAEEGTKLYSTLELCNSSLGQYPGKAIKLKQKPKKKQAYFLTKLVSPNDPDYKFTIAPRLIEQFGMPRDHLGDEMLIVEQ